MEVICLQEPAYYAMLDKVMAYVREQNAIKEDKWVSGETVMKMLNISSKTTLQKLRDEGKIRFSQPEKKIIVYDITSVHKYLEDNAYETF
jgi:hypothetical protein